MPKLDRTGPEGKGPKTGRKLGKCRKTETENNEPIKFEKWQGMGLRRKMEGGKGLGRRLRSFFRCP